MRLVAFQDRERQGELEQARALAEEQRQRRLIAERAARRQRILSGGLAVVVALAVLAAGVAVLLQLKAQHQTAVARSQTVANQSLIRKDAQLDLALLLGIEALRPALANELNGAESFEARNAVLTEVTANPRLRAFLEAPGKDQGRRVQSRRQAPGLGQQRQHGHALGRRHPAARGPSHDGAHGQGPGASRSTTTARWWPPAARTAG